MVPFSYREGTLCAEEVPLRDIAQEVGTPFYAYAQSHLEANCRALRQAVPEARLLYAVKANSNIAILRTLLPLGVGLDVVSQGEIHRGLAAGAQGSQMIFSGVGKTPEEIRFAVAHHIAQINAESQEELHLLKDIGRTTDTPIPVGVRVNPHVAAGTHDKITTGRREDKFGIPSKDVVPLCQEMQTWKGVQFMGLAVHIGSQITSLSPFEKAFMCLRGLTEDLRQLGIAVPRLDLGGGLGIPMPDTPTPPSPEAYGALIRRCTQDLELEVCLAPGRFLAGPAGVLVASVVRRKQAGGRALLVVDAAMNDFLRHTLYGAHHEVRALTPQGPETLYDIVGPVCETGDVLAREVPLAATPLIAIMDTGAYGAVMASAYNSRLLPPEVMVKGNQWAVVRARPTYEDMLSQECLPPWLST